MKTYNVTLEMSITKNITVCAASEEQAVHGACDMFFQIPDDEGSFDLRTIECSEAEDY